MSVSIHEIKSRVLVDGGITVDAGGNVVTETEGYIVGLNSSYTDSLDKAVTLLAWSIFTAAIRKVGLKKFRGLGTLTFGIFKDGNRYSADVGVVVGNISQALALANEAGQQSIWNLKTNTVMMVNPSDWGNQGFSIDYITEQLV